MAKQRQTRQPNKWLTNVYSPFVPRSAGDTTKEMAALFEQKSKQYGIGKESFQKQRTALDAIKAAPGNKDFLAESIASYNDQYQKAEKEGDFENKMYDAGDIAADLATKYNYKKLQEDHTQYTAEAKSIQEDKTLSQRQKEYILARHLADNKEGGRDSEGNLVYQNYTSMKPLVNEDTPANLMTYLGKMKADGHYREVEGQPGMIQVRTDIFSRLGITKDMTLTKERLLAVAEDFIRNSPQDMASIEDESEVAIGSVFLAKQAKDEIATIEDVVETLNINNRAPYGSEAYIKFIQDREAYIVEKLKVKRAEAEEENEVFNQQKELKRLGKFLDTQDRLYNYTKNAADALTTHDETISTWENKNLTDTGGGALADIGKTTFKSTDMYVSNQRTIQEDYNAQKEQVVTWNDDIKNLNSEIKALEEEHKNNSTEEGSPVILSDIKQKKEEVEELTKKIQYGERLTSNTGRGLYKWIKDNGYFEDISIEDYAKSQLEADKKLSGKGDTEINDETIAERVKIIEEEMMDALTDNDVVYNSRKPHIKAVGDNVEEITASDSFSRTYKGFDIGADANTKAETKFYRRYFNMLDDIKETLLFDPTQVNTLGGESMQEFLKEYYAQEKSADKLKFTLGTTPSFNGELTGHLSYEVPKEIEGEIVKPKSITFAFPRESAGNVASTNNIVKIVMKEVADGLMENYDNLSEDKKEEVQKAIDLVNIADGTYQEFNELQLRSLPEGEKVGFELGEEDYLFTAYKLLDGTHNKFILEKQYADGYEIRDDGSSVSVTGERVAYGYNVIQDIDKNGKVKIINGREVTPQWYGVDRNSYTIKGNEVRFKNFKPFNFDDPDVLLHTISLMQAKEEGTMDKSAPPSTKLHKNPKEYRNTHLDAETVNLTTNNGIESKEFAREKGFYPLRDIFGAENISINAKSPFIKFNNTGINKLVDAKNRVLEQTGKNVVISSGNRGIETNEKVGGAKKSKHLEGLALDILYDDAGKAFIELLQQKMKHYGVVYIAPSKERGFYHISFSEDLAWTPPKKTYR